MLILNDINFGSVIGASGIQGCFGREDYIEYPIHRILKKIQGFSFEGMTFVAKTFTLNPHKGYTPLAKDGFSVRDWFPQTVVPNVWHGFFTCYLNGVAWNAFGLSNPGAHFLFEHGWWQERTEPFMLSWMAVAKTKTERLQEARDLVGIFQQHLPDFKAKIALQVNYSCPNTDHSQDELLSEVVESLTILSDIGIPLIPKFNVLLHHETAVKIAQATHNGKKLCAAFCLTNTLKRDDLPAELQKKAFARGNRSLLGFGSGGGISGQPLYNLLFKWLGSAASVGLDIPIIAGGGILHPRQIHGLVGFKSVEAVSPGSVSFLRPWRLQGIIDAGNSVTFSSNFENQSS